MERKTLENSKEARDHAVLVGLRSPVLGDDSADEESLMELSELVDTAGGDTAGIILQSREKPDPHSFIGEGKVEEVKRMVDNEQATMVIFDNDLSPSQIRVLTELLGVQVIDRSGLILDIFAQRARTKEGCLQVELAQYQYLLPRLVGMWTHLERQAGTSGKGPIGSKGPGETQLETDRRHIHRKIDKLKAELEEVRRVRGTQRQRRMKNEIPVVAIVGYTNAGKSTLLNAITGAGIPANDRLFDTLDKTLEMAKVTAEVTHNHPEGIKGAQATAAVIFLARTGHSKPEIKQYVEQTFGYDLNRTCDEIRPTYHHVETCQETVPEAIIAFLESVSFEDALRNAVSLGGDSDTLACITGGIAEAFYGMPQELRDETLKRLPEDIREAYELLCFMIAKMI